MAYDIEIYKKIIDFSSETPDPKRAEANLIRFIETVPKIEYFSPYLKETAKLFAVSQFLANFCISNPDELLNALKTTGESITKKFLSEKSREELAFMSQKDSKDIIKDIRLFKKRYLLRITLRDIAGITDILGSMDELTSLAEVIIDFALKYSSRIVSQKFGDPTSDEELALIALGKLGGEELNYSSDIDLMAVYSTEEGQTSGVLSPSGIRMNRISNSEFYCKVVELFNRMLSSNTGDGIAYRVDLRLRPQGQKGEIALPVKAYQTYYESWGRTWERMALIRARPVTGSMHIGKMFMEMIDAFVWEKTIDYSGVEEIRALKKKIDSAFSRDDIKRGYGGIREAEFFIQTFQLIYGSQHAGLRTHRFLNAMQSLRWLGIIPEEDLVTLWDIYLHLRRIEHFLQMKDDLQTHSLPTSDDDLRSLSIKMKFSSLSGFLSDLRLRRMKIRNMYNSLLGTEEDIHDEALTLLEGDLNDEELTEYLSFRGLKKPSSGLISLKGVREQFDFLKTQRERTAMRKVIPLLIEKALSAENSDRAIRSIESFFTTIGIKETYLTGLIERKELREGIIKIFSLSIYLTRLFLSSPIYLDLLLEGNVIRKTLRRTKEEIRRSILKRKFETGIAVYKNAEEIRLGMFFLMRVLDVNDLARYLSHLAEAIIKITTERSLAPRNLPFGLSVFGLGKLGGREIIFGSDIDLIFLSEKPDDLKIVERIIKTLTAYTDRGILYNVDMRLRPDGSKGALLMDIDGYRNYYLKSAHPWEIQALLKLRPLAGDEMLARSFMEMVRKVILKRGEDLKIEDVKTMRERIIMGLSHESKGIDVKLGPGGMEDIEFYVQWLQLQHAKRFPNMIVQNTFSAIRHLMKKRVLNTQNGEDLFTAYRYLRSLETFMRLNEEHVITEEAEFAEIAGIFMGHKGKDEFLKHLNTLRERVRKICLFV